IGLTPFEKPDVNLMPKLHQAGAFPVLSLGHDLASAQEALNRFDQTALFNYGIYFPNDKLLSLQIPEKVNLIILPFGTCAPTAEHLPIVYQVNSLEEALLAK